MYYAYPVTRFDSEPRNCGCCDELLTYWDLERDEEGEWLPELCAGCRQEGCNTEEPCKNQECEE